MPVGNIHLPGELQLPENASGVVLFADGGGGHNFRNQFAAGILREAGIGTLIFDLLTYDEAAADAATGVLRYNIEMFAIRLIGATGWLMKQPGALGLKVGYFGAGTGSGAALVAAAELGDLIAAVVSRGGRPDLAGDALPKVESPTLLVVGDGDKKGCSLNGDAYEKLCCKKDFWTVRGATHLFEEPGKLEEVARIGAHWFHKHLATSDDGEESV
ncbi:MAG: alpha/beta hydrolase [Verrucomicrobia bacterium]|nr:alpha/beta hydrolase [Verrucomicrobiota bacterium]